MATVEDKARRMKSAGSKDRSVNGEKNVNSRRRNKGNQIPDAKIGKSLKGPGV